jgi:oligopeptide/dipeptide ABC transporter ATP-binding protein
LVGESGCGKSTLIRIAVQLESPESGSINIDGIEQGRWKFRNRRFLSTQIALIPQESNASLDPRMTIGESIAEPLVIHRRGNTREREERVIELLHEVGLDSAMSKRYPHQLSGGQRQRTAIARSLALEPRLLIADEPVSALDVSVQAQILELLRDIQRQRTMALLLVAHDLAFARSIADRIVVMYLGRIVESGVTEKVISQPAHPYTASLIAAFPNPDPRQRGDRVAPVGEVPSAINLPTGCSFASRCLRAKDLCRAVDPPLETAISGVTLACHFPLY